MSGFDDPGIFYSDSFGGDAQADEGQARKSQLQRRFKEFLRQYRVGTDRTGFTFKYRCGSCGGSSRQPHALV
uniref:Minichromosome maintenance complex component 5 n=1 Tax=Gorilla gorilla gorilla TaxID=9595 RepID=A0A2I2ZIB0_GORGO